MRARSWNLKDLADASPLAAAFVMEPLETAHGDKGTEVNTLKQTFLLGDENFVA